MCTFFFDFIYIDLNSYSYVSNFTGPIESQAHCLVDFTEGAVITSATRSYPELKDLLPQAKVKSILKKDVLNKNETENLLDANRKNVYYTTCRDGTSAKDQDTRAFNKCNVNDIDNYNITAETTVSSNVCKNNNVFQKESKTGNMENNMHESSKTHHHPIKQQSSESYTDDSQLNTFDKSEDEALFSDSIAISAFNTGKANIWQNADIHGIITWQTDTSPSDNLENEENLCSFSTEHSPSEDIDPATSFNTSPSFQSHETGDCVNRVKPDTINNRFPDVRNNSSVSEHSDVQEIPSNKIIPLEQIMQRLQRTPSCETSPTIPSPGASG